MPPGMPPGKNLYCGACEKGRILSDRRKELFTQSSRNFSRSGGGGLVFIVSKRAYLYMHTKTALMTNKTWIDITKYYNFWNTEGGKCLWSVSECPSPNQLSSTAWQLSTKVMPLARFRIDIIVLVWSDLKWRQWDTNNHFLNENNFTIK